MISRPTARLTLITLGTAVLYALPALADGEGKPGLPQLDTSLFPEQLFWLVIAFTLLYLLMAFVALPDIEHTQDSRKNKISAEIHAASEANDLAKSIIVQYEKALAEARTEAQVTVTKIATQAAKDLAAQQSIQKQTLTKRLHEAETSITLVRDAAIRDVQGAAGELGRGLVEKILSGGELSGGVRG